MIPMKIGIETRSDNDTVELTLENLTHRYFLSSMIIYRGTGYLLGPFSPGDTLSRRLRISSAPVSPSMDEIDSGNLEPLEAGIIEILLGYQKWESLQEEGAIFFVAWFADEAVAAEYDPTFLIERGADILLVAIPPSEWAYEST